MIINLFFICSILFFIFCFKQIGFSFRRKSFREIASEESPTLGDRAHLDYDIRYEIWKISIYLLIVSSILFFCK